MEVKKVLFVCLIFYFIFSGPNSQVFSSSNAVYEIKRITDDDYEDYTPQIFGPYITWSKFMPTKGTLNNEIFLFDRRTQSQVRLTWNLFEDTFPKIDGNYIVWKRDIEKADGTSVYALILYNITTKERTHIDWSLNNPQGAHYIKANRVGWTKDNDIFLYDIATGVKKRLTKNNITDYLSDSSPISPYGLVW